MEQYIECEHWKVFFSYELKTLNHFEEVGLCHETLKGSLSLQCFRLMEMSSLWRLNK